MSISKIRWGIIGPGNMASEFVRDLCMVCDADTFAVASRSKERANLFARAFNMKYAYGSYQEMIDDGRIDIAYVATPHAFHLEHTLMCLEKGISVLCEKPASLTRKEAQKMIATSRAQNVFFMEALWTRFLPAISTLQEIIESSVMGEIINIQAEFCFRAPVDPESILYDLNLGGGSLLDVGIYPVFLAYLILGRPLEIKAQGQIHASGADQNCQIELRYPRNKTAYLHSSIIYEKENIAKISFENGHIILRPEWYKATGLYIYHHHQKVKYISCPTLGKGFTYEIRECHRALRANEVESPYWTHQNVLDVLEILDEIRQQVGVAYPAERTTEKS